LKKIFDNIEKKQRYLIFALFLFATYCALTIGEAWDEKAMLIHGKITLNYLLSFGQIKEDFIYRENYSTLYFSTLYLLTKAVPLKYEIEATHIINLFFSLLTIYGISKFVSEVFNKHVGKIIFIIMFFYPIFFGHMGINSKDTILALCHVWISFFIFRYIKNQHNKTEARNYLILIALLASVGSGIQLVFLGSLLPIFIFIILDIFYFKKISVKKFNIAKFLFDTAICFVLFYILLVIFWIDTYPNIFVLPFKFLFATFSETYWTGWPHNLINGIYYDSDKVPKNYIIINFILKSPEYILILYILFIIYLFKNKSFFIKSFNEFNYKIIFVFSLIIFPNLILLFVPYPIYDGMRLFLWTLPYFLIIPSLVIYYLYKNKVSKIINISLSLAAIYFIFNFIQITPYQYTYLNILNGKKSERYQKFENDYWGTSLNELIKYSKVSKNKKYLIGTCGVSPHIAKKISYKIGYKNFKFVNEKDADLIIMTNRVIKNNNKLTNCFDKYDGKNLSVVKRGGSILSTIRKIK